MVKQIVKPLTLEIDKKTWEEFKEKVPRSLTLNQAVVLLIEQEVKG